jgi:microcystin-dependent protein
MFAGNFAPVGWAFCDGSIIPISENDTLFNLIGTTYGGDGQSTFALPNLQSRIPMHQGAGFILAEAGGVESVTLTVTQVPSHSHALVGSASTASSSDPAGNVGARATAAAVFPYGTDAPAQPLAPQAVGSTGGSQPHENMQPFLCVNFIISLFGIFPTQT